VLECFEQHGADFSGRLGVLYAGDEHVHIDFGLQANGVLADWFPAYDPRFARYSPGVVSMLEMIRTATADPRVRELDMGKGSAPFKESLKSYDATVAEGFIDRTSVASLVWRARTMPKRKALEIVLGDDRLRLAARRVLNEVGALRSKVPSGSGLRR
jgi:CelD/BcsL family acetyltransferase involved in cellulose biosynthesis